MFKAKSPQVQNRPIVLTSVQRKYLFKRSDCASIQVARTLATQTIERRKAVSVSYEVWELIYMQNDK